MSEKFLIVGLGNPGAEYAKTRHNIGFMVVDRLAAEYNALFKKGRNADEEARFQIGGDVVFAAKPLDRKSVV